MGSDWYKFLKKGFEYMTKNGRNLDKIQFNAMNTQNR